MGNGMHVSNNNNGALSQKNAALTQRVEHWYNMYQNLHSEIERGVYVHADAANAQLQEQINRAVSGTKGMQVFPILLPNGTATVHKWDTHTEVLDDRHMYTLDYLDDETRTNAARHVESARVVTLTKQDNHNASTKPTEVRLTESDFSAHFGDNPTPNLRTRVNWDLRALTRRPDRTDEYHPHALAHAQSVRRTTR
jgi:hypothetical protein